MNEQLREDHLSGRQSQWQRQSAGDAEPRRGEYRARNHPLAHRCLLIGPFFTGFSKPAHVVIPSVSPRGIFNMSAFTSAEIHRQREQQS